jgi:hypothetical protein
MIGTSLKNEVSSFVGGGNHFLVEAWVEAWLKCLPIDLLLQQGKCESSLFGHV